jgi:5-methylcytosine-specific restriction endonuclease McrBC regulatory subunit McrC
VVDVKYNAEQPAGYPNADLYQLLAYCTALGLRRGLSSTPRAAVCPLSTPCGTPE